MAPDTGMTQASTLSDATRLALQQATPYQQVLGLRIDGQGPGWARVAMPAIARIASRDDQARIDPLALVGLVDHGLSHALIDSIPAGAGMSTLELQVQWTGLPMVPGALLLDARAMAIDHGSATLRGTVAGADGATIAAASAVFRIGGYPTADTPDPAGLAPFDPADLCGPLHAALGWDESDEAIVLRPDNQAVLGWAIGGIVHGVVVAALLQAACERIAPPGQRLASLTIHYLRPCRGALAAQARAEPVRLGQAASVIGAEVVQAGRVVATARALLV